MTVVVTYATNEDEYLNSDLFSSVDASRLMEIYLENRLSHALTLKC